MAVVTDVVVTPRFVVIPVVIKHVAPGLRPGPRGCTGYLAGAWEVSPQKTPLLKGTRGSKGFFVPDDIVSPITTKEHKLMLTLH